MSMTIGVSIVPGQTFRIPRGASVGLDYSSTALEPHRQRQARHLPEHGDFDVTLRWRGEKNSFDLFILFDAPGDIEDYRYFSPEPIHINLDRLKAHHRNIRAYGVELGQLLFGQRAGSYLDRAFNLASRMPVHMRLVVDDNAPLPYRSIRWETLRHPTSEKPVTTSDNIRFSRYLSNPDGTSPSPLGLRDGLSALVVVANPGDIEGYNVGLSQLSPPKMTAEIDRAKKALDGMAVRVLMDEGKRATAQNIVDALRERTVNALYLVCHGLLDKSGPVLLLENEHGNVHRVDGADLAERIGNLGQRVPTLAVLVSCQSAGPSDDALAALGAVDTSETVEAMEESASTLTAFGPALSRAGCAVVVAMQGNISVDTAARFMPKFFEELRKDGIAEHAMALARSAIKDEQDWYVPVLYSRLRGGSAWYLPGFGQLGADLMSNLRIRIANKHCTPIVGSGVAAEDGIFPTRERVASEWAERRQAPMRDQAKTDLASVAQFIAVESDNRGLVRDELLQYLRSYLKRQHGAKFKGLDWDEGELDEHIRAIGRHQRKASGGKDCYSRLARFNSPVFVTTAWSGLLEDALVEAEKSPETRHFEWYRSLPSSPPGDDQFSVARPLVYHLFGTLDTPRSLVLSEDDYFTWLRAWMKQVDKRIAIPHYIGPPLMDRSLIFLGYGFDDWEFRMIVQAIKGFEGSDLSDTRHVGVQFEPGALRIEPQAAHEYLERYLGADNLDVYWGSCAEFLEELQETGGPS
jgi:hypothetical protein